MALSAPVDWAAAIASVASPGSSSRDFSGEHEKHLATLFGLSTSTVQDFDLKDCIDEEFRQLLTSRAREFLCQSWRLSKLPDYFVRAGYAEYFTGRSIDYAELVRKQESADCSSEQGRQAEVEAAAKLMQSGKIHCPRKLSTLLPSRKLHELFKGCLARKRAAPVHPEDCRDTAFGAFLTQRAKEFMVDVARLPVHFVQACYAEHFLKLDIDYELLLRITEARSIARQQTRQKAAAEVVEGPAEYEEESEAEHKDESEADDKHQDMAPIRNYRKLSSLVPFSKFQKLFGDCRKFQSLDPRDCIDSVFGQFLTQRANELLPGSSKLPPSFVQACYAEHYLGLEMDYPRLRESAKSWRPTTNLQANDKNGTNIKKGEVLPEEADKRLEKCQRCERNRKKRSEAENMVRDSEDKVRKLKTRYSMRNRGASCVLCAGALSPPKAGTLWAPVATSTISSASCSIPSARAPVWSAKCRFLRSFTRLSATSEPATRSKRSYFLSCRKYSTFEEAFLLEARDAIVEHLFQGQEAAKSQALELPAVHLVYDILSSLQRLPASAASQQTKLHRSLLLLSEPPFRSKCIDQLLESTRRRGRGPVQHLGCGRSRWWCSGTVQHNLHVSVSGDEATGVHSPVSMLRTTRIVLVGVGCNRGPTTKEGFTTTRLIPCSLLKSHAFCSAKVFARGYHSCRQVLLIEIGPRPLVQWRIRLGATVVVANSRARGRHDHLPDGLELGTGGTATQ